MASAPERVARLWESRARAFEAEVERLRKLLADETTYHHNEHARAEKAEAAKERLVQEATTQTLALKNQLEKAEAEIERLREELAITHEVMTKQHEKASHWISKGVKAAEAERDELRRIAGTELANRVALEDELEATKQNLDLTTEERDRYKAALDQQEEK